MLRLALSTILVTLIVSAIVTGKSVVTNGDNEVNITTGEQAVDSKPSDVPDSNRPKEPPREEGEGQSLLPPQAGKRSVRSHPNYVHTVVSRSDSPVTLVRAELQSRARRETEEELLARSRQKRAVVDNPNKWNDTIPVVFDASYLALGDELVGTVLRAMTYISNHVCVRYEDVTNIYDPANEHWFTENGYATDAYLLIKDGGGCAAGNGQGNGLGPKSVTPCKGFGIIMHEILHTLGGVHYQQIPSRDNYLTVNRDNVQPSLQGTYNISQPNHGFLVGKLMDPRSDLMYGDQTWTQNGLSTYEPVRDEIFSANVYASTEEIIFQELSRVHRCNEKYCDGAVVDCGLGYHTLNYGVCRCICPPEWDPATNCKELLNGPAVDIQWPKTPLAVFAGGPNHECPTGFDQTVSWVSFTGLWPTLQLPVPYTFPTETKTMYIPVCEKSAPANENIDWESWPLGGAYCIIKPAGTPCGGVFGEFTFEIESQAEVHRNGTAGDITVSGRNLTIKLCCRYSENYALPLTLPNDKPFRVFAKGVCPTVEGMRGYKGLLDFYCDNKQGYGAIPPQHYIFTKELQVYQCYYQPPVYGCNQVITLDANTKTAQVTTPGYPNAREPNRRCLYHFNIPSNAQIKITFDDFDLHPDDMLIDKRFHRWQVPYQIPNDNYPYEFISEKDYLYMEYWASWQTAGVTNKGLKFTAQLILPEDLCYDSTTNGEDYQGGTDITETYEECLPWIEAAECSDFPYDDPLSSVWLMWSASNHCRNPGGKLLQPWCYTYKNGTNCHRRFCDVCNLRAPVDKLKHCEELMNEDKSFCETGIQRFGCFKSCGFVQRSAEPGAPCSKRPFIPTDGEVVKPLKDVYQRGEKLKVICSEPDAPTTSNSMMCTQRGWTPLKYACTECPEGWTKYKDRCLFLEGTNRTYGRDAETRCQSYGTTGTLMQIRDEEDQKMLRRLKMGDGHRGTSWVSGELDRDTLEWKYTNLDTPLGYFNWSEKQLGNTDVPFWNCLLVIAEFYEDKGGWKPTNCDNTRNSFAYACQLDKYVITAVSNCTNKAGYWPCRSAMTDNPRFCKIPRLRGAIEESCKEACGYCDDINFECQEEVGDTYTRTSESPIIDGGDFMTFACKAGYYHISGDLQRACFKGRLLGNPPVCEAQPVARDVNLNAVIPRHQPIPVNRAILLDHDGYRMPFKGSITKWYYHCKEVGRLHFLVYRRSGDTFTFVGSNNITCVAGWIWSYNVPAADQISVQQNDIIGVYTPDRATLSGDVCEGAPVPVLPNPSVFTRNPNALPTLAFTQTFCLVPSVGVHVEPN